MQKKKEKLDKEIEDRAIDLVTDSLITADKRNSEIDEEEKMRMLQEKSLELLEEYKDSIDPQIFEEAKQEIKSKTKSSTRRARTEE